MRQGQSIGSRLYKQYATIFYKMFQEKDFYIPIYDIQDRVKDYDGEEIELGEYFIKQVEYAGWYNNVYQYQEKAQTDHV